MSIELESAKPEPLFVLDLGSNGGTLAPATFESLLAWVTIEQAAWHWITARSFGSVDASVREAVQPLHDAVNNINSALQNRDINPQRASSMIGSAVEHIRGVFIDRRLPHTSSVVFKRIAEIRSELTDVGASYYLAVRLDKSSTIYQPNEINAWRGLLAGVTDQFGPLGPGQSNLRALEGAIDDLRQKLEQTIGQSQQTFDKLYRDYQGVSGEIAIERTTMSNEFSNSQLGRDGEFDEQMSAHKAGMEALRKAFREEMSLRAPAQYWTRKRNAHRWIALAAGALSFGGIGLCAYFLAAEIKGLLEGTPSGTSPDSWRLAVLALVAVFSLWAVRLIVRIFLSHLHLAGDASERKVMLETYLSLMEGNQLANDGERTLILNALFRQASDGIVKDDGVPPSAINFLTKGGR